MCGHSGCCGRCGERRDVEAVSAKQLRVKKRVRPSRQWCGARSVKRSSALRRTVPRRARQRLNAPERPAQPRRAAAAGSKRCYISTNCVQFAGNGAKARPSSTSPIAQAMRERARSALPGNRALDSFLETPGGPSARSRPSWERSGKPKVELRARMPRGVCSQSSRVKSWLQRVRADPIRPAMRASV